MRILLILALAVASLFLTGCDYGFSLHPEEMTPDQMLHRAELVFVGVVQEQHFDSWPFFRPPDNAEIRRQNAEYWRPLRRRVRVETVLRGTYTGEMIDIYEIFGGVAPNTNHTTNNERYLFLIRKESGRWRLVRDWRGSIGPVETGYHARLPLDDTHSFWERYDLMYYWVGKDQTASGLLFTKFPVGYGISQWRQLKLVRGLVHHPQRQVRESACGELFGGGWGQYDCLRTLSQSERAEAGLPNPDAMPPDRDLRLPGPANEFRNLFGWNLQEGNIDSLRVLTAVDNPTLRREFCAKFMAKFPHDTDNGCPADKPLPATIVTENGDVPLVGPWPQ